MVYNNPVLLVDIYGLTPALLAAAAGAGLGALTGLAGGLAYQVVSVLKGNCFNGKAILASGAGGAVTGAIIGGTAGLLVGDPSALIARTTLLGSGVISIGAGAAGGTVAGIIGAPSNSGSDSGSGSGSTTPPDTPNPNPNN